MKIEIVLDLTIVGSEILRIVKVYSPYADSKCGNSCDKENTVLDDRVVSVLGGILNIGPITTW